MRLFCIQILLTTLVLACSLSLTSSASSNGQDQSIPDSRNIPDPQVQLSRRHLFASEEVSVEGPASKGASTVLSHVKKRSVSSSSDTFHVPRPVHLFPHLKKRMYSADAQDNEATPKREGALKRWWHWLTHKISRRHREPSSASPTASPVNPPRRYAPSSTTMTPAPTTTHARSVAPGAAGVAGAAVPLGAIQAGVPSSPTPKAYDYSQKLEKTEEESDDDSDSSDSDDDEEKGRKMGMTNTQTMGYDHVPTRTGTRAYERGSTISKTPTAPSLTPAQRVRLNWARDPGPPPTPEEEDSESSEEEEDEEEDMGGETGEDTESDEEGRRKTTPPTPAHSSVDSKPTSAPSRSALTTSLATPVAAVNVPVYGDPESEADTESETDSEGSDSEGSDSEGNTSEGSESEGSDSEGSETEGEGTTPSKTTSTFVTPTPRSVETSSVAPHLIVSPPAHTPSHFPEYRYPPTAKEEMNESDSSSSAEDSEGETSEVDEDTEEEEEEEKTRINQPRILYYHA
ncbi:MAG: hypothetical protein DHS80DRAFT_20950 [Piptocephalis tieghemiana]|nr:MAG: hypothetical protein DHS80DRAFT_20950 [Piptocephalis tieghemiana]